MNKLKFVFFGSAYFSAIILERITIDRDLKNLLSIEFTVTQPDKPKGRKQVLTPTPVKLSSEKHGIKTYVEINDEVVSRLKNTDLVLLYAYGAIIKKDILDLPKFGFWNIHPSLLPQYRGTAPMATPLINGDKNTGVTIMKMDDMIDHGSIIAQRMYTIEKDDKRPDLEVKLTNMGFEMFKSAILNGADKIELKEQEHEKATYTKKLNKNDGFIDMDKLKKMIMDSPQQIYNLYRGLYTWPGIWTILPNNKRLKLTEIELLGNQLSIKKVQLEGKKEVDFETFSKAYGFFK